jgi:hypothetical protein
LKKTLDKSMNILALLTKNLFSALDVNMKIAIPKPNTFSLGNMSLN